MRALKTAPKTVGQLPLNIALRDDASFANFFADSNVEAVTAIEALSKADAGEYFIYIWGNSAVGKTHLLQAACRQQAALQAPAAYLSLRDADVAPPILDGLETLSLVCIDDVEVIAGQEEWEVALFYLYNRLRANNGRLLVSASTSPTHTKVRLLDLRSRLAAGLVLQIADLSDEGKIAALQLHAQHRGLELADEVGQFILRRSPRDLRVLIGLLEQLDKASLAAGRKLTVPFVKQIIQDMTP